MCSVLNGVLGFAGSLFIKHNKVATRINLVRVLSDLNKSNFEILPSKGKRRGDLSRVNKYICSEMAACVNEGRGREDAVG